MCSAPALLQTSKGPVAQAFNPAAEAERPATEAERPPTKPDTLEPGAPEAPKLEPADAPKPEPMDEVKPDPEDEPKPEPGDAEDAPAEAPQPQEATARVVVLSSVRPGKPLLLYVLIHAQCYKALCMVALRS